MPAFSLAALTVLDLAPPALIDVAAACGYDAVGIRLLPAMPGGIAYPLDDKASLKETLARLDATGIKVAEVLRGRRAIRDDGRSRIHALDLCA
jgi:sugar phosphate isomerase/epimerase